MSAEMLAIAPAPAEQPAERTCAACGYHVVEFRPLEHCPMCGTAREHLRPVVVEAGAAA